LTPPQTAPCAPQHAVSELPAFWGTSQIKSLLVQHCLSVVQRWPDLKQRLPLPFPLFFLFLRRASPSSAAKTASPPAPSAAAPSRVSTPRRLLDRANVLAMRSNR
jgi:hypothetical protein